MTVFTFNLAFLLPIFQSAQLALFMARFFYESINEISGCLGQHIPEPLIIIIIILLSGVPPVRAHETEARVVQTFSPGESYSVNWKRFCACLDCSST